MKTRVVNIRQEQADVYIGRAGHGYDGFWGNPYPVSLGRQQCINAYLRYVLNRPDILIRLPELKGKLLGCFCKPSACHGDVLAFLCELSEDNLAKVVAMFG